MNKLSTMVDGGKPDPRLTHFIAVQAAYPWAWGKAATFQGAIKNMRQASSRVGRNFAVFAVSEATEVNDGGGFTRPKADPKPVLLKAVNEAVKNAEAHALLAGF